jgi:hypothetical protein
MLRNHLPRLSVGSRKSASSRERAARAVPRVESLEDRTVPSTLEVGAEVGFEP